MYCKDFWFKYFVTLLMTIQIKEKGKDAYRSWELIARFDFSVSIRIPEQQFAFTRVMQAAFIRIEPFWGNKFDRIWINLAQIGQIWRVSWGLHTFTDMTTIGIIERMRKLLRFIFVSSFDYSDLLEFLIFLYQSFSI